MRLFLFSVLYWITVSSDSTNQCNPSLWKTPDVFNKPDPDPYTLSRSNTSYCTNKRTGSAYCNAGWMWGVQTSGSTCLEKGNVADGCPCWSTGCDGFDSRTGSCKCTMESDPSQNYCFTTTQTCGACAIGQYRAGCGCTKPDGGDWICIEGTCTDLPSRTLISYEIDGFRNAYDCAKGLTLSISHAQHFTFTHTQHFTFTNFLVFLGL